MTTMANPEVQTVSTGADKAKLAAAALLVVGAVVAFYVLGKQDLWLRVGALVLLMAGAIGVFFTSEPGKQLIAYGQDSARDAQGSDADDRLCVRVRVRDGAVPVADGQDIGVGHVRPDPGLEEVRTPR
jgi:hypothetical protein